METKGDDKSNRVAEIKVQKRMVLYFEMHLCPKLDGPPEFQGMATDPIDHDTVQKYVEDWVNDIYNPVNEWLMRLISGNSAVTVSLAISGQALELLAQYTPVAMQSLTKLNESGAIEWLALPYNNSLSVLVSHDAYMKEVIRHKELLYKHFGIETKTLLAAPFFEPAMPALGSAMGFDGLILKSDVWPGHSVVFDEANSISLLGTDRNITDAVMHRFGAGRSALSADDLISMVNHTSDDTVVIGFPYEMFQLHQRAGVYAIFEAFVAQAALDRKLLTPSDIIHDTSDHTMPHLSVEMDADTMALQGNDLQRQALAAAKELDTLGNQLVDESYHNELMQLLAADHFLNMSSRASRLTNPYLSPQEALNNYRAALTSLKSRMEGATTRDDDRPARNVEAERQHINTPVWVLQEQNKYKEVSHPPL